MSKVLLCFLEVGRKIWLATECNIMLDMNEMYIRFMAPVAQHSVERLLSLIDMAYRDEHVDTIHLLLSTPGGSVKHAIDVYNFLRGIPLKVITYNFGTVDSIGIVMFCAGDIRKSAPHSRFLLHPVTSGVPPGIILDQHNLMEAQNSLQVDQENIARVVAHTTGEEVKSVLGKINSRQTLNAEEAKKYKLVQEIDNVLLPADARLEVVKESEAAPIPQMLIPQPSAKPLSYLPPIQNEVRIPINHYNIQ